MPYNGRYHPISLPLFQLQLKDYRPIAHETTPDMQPLLVSAPLGFLPAAQDFHIPDDPVEIRLSGGILDSQGADAVFAVPAAFHGNGVQISVCRDVKFFLMPSENWPSTTCVGPSPYLRQTREP